ncbi:iron-containing alcohol dehydrogenase family protein [Ureibacillus sp. GCM10028918]|uniref:iron-containing alcohol dehydrogenase family protein n=1 Tax=Ureibacillus sp. GCM10028918 TaxID=3273429 RepID=UPI003613CFB0
MSHLSCFPTRLLIGENALNQVNDVLKEFGTKNILLVTDKGLTAAGIVDKVVDCIKNSGADITIFNETKPEPTISNFKSALELAKGIDIDLVIGLGGGSAIDLAKAVALLLKHDKEFLEFVGINKVPSPGLPTIMISTTSGTGSEVSKFAVLTDEETHLKSVIASPNIVPTVAVVDPALTYTLPPVITAHTGLDALVHVIEGYLAQRNSNFSNELALVGLKKIWNHIEAAYEDGLDKEARYEMAIGSMIGGLVLNTTDGAGMVHGLAFSLGVYCNLPHGLSNSLMLPYTLKYLAPYCEEELVTLAKNVNIVGDSNTQTIERFIEEIIQLQKRLNLPITLEELGIEESLLETLAESSYTQERLQSNSPKRLEKDELLAIFKQAYNGQIILNEG